MSVDQMRSYQIGETKRGRLAAIELYLAYTFVLPVTDAELAAFSALLDDVDTAEKITLINGRLSAGRQHRAGRRKLLAECCV